MERWPNRLFFVTNMNKNLTKIRRITAVFVLGFMLFSALIPAGNTLAFDWSFGLGPNLLSSDAANASSQTFGFISSLSNLSSETPANVNLETLTVSGGNFLLPSASTLTGNNKKIPKVTIDNELTVLITGYSSTLDQTDDSPFITANGTYVRDGIIAANFLPFGTRIKIPEIFGDKIFVVEDRMNRRYWQNVDIWFPDRASAREFGLKKAKIQILES